MWGSDITPDQTPFEAGLGFCVREGDSFQGARAVREREPRSKLRCMVLDDPRAVVLGNEPVAIGGEVLGRVTSGGYGYTVERSIAYAYVPAEIDPGERVEVDVFGSWIPGEIVRTPLFDPRGERVRGPLGEAAEHPAGQ